MVTTWKNQLAAFILHLWKSCEVFMLYHQILYFSIIKLEVQRIQILFFFFFFFREHLLTYCVSWRREWQPTPVLLPGKSHGQRSPVGYSPWGRKKSDTTEQLYLLTCLLCICFWELGHSRTEQNPCSQETWDMWVSNTGKFHDLLELSFPFLSQLQFRWKQIIPNYTDSCLSTPFHGSCRLNHP